MFYFERNEQTLISCPEGLKMSAVCVDTLFPRMHLVSWVLSSLLTPAGPGLLLQTDVKQETQRSTSSEDQDLLLRAPERAGEFSLFIPFSFLISII